MGFKFQGRPRAIDTTGLVSFPELPVPFLQRNQLLKLASTLERPLKIDAATSDLRCLSMAQVLIEVDVVLPLIKCVWVGDDKYGFWQSVMFENLPSYCSSCNKFGHDQRFGPSLRASAAERGLPSRT